MGTERLPLYRNEPSIPVFAPRFCLPVLTIAPFQRVRYGLSSPLICGRPYTFLQVVNACSRERRKAIILCDTLRHIYH